jgi:2-oxoglutarate dehydrogenase E2 component (dihydrolipoamide succinyltransferase)
MATTLDDLAADLQRFFAAKFPGGGEGPGSLLLVFDPAGRPLPSREFVGSGAPGVPNVLAHQWAAQCADDVAAANLLARGVYLAVDGSRLSRWYAATVGGSIATATARPAVQAFENAKHLAERQLEQNKLVVISGTAAGGLSGTVAAPGTHDTYYATSMTPVDWYLDTATCWQVYQFDAADRPVTPPPPSKGVLRPPAFQFRVADEATSPAVADYAVTGRIPVYIELNPQELKLELPEHAGDVLPEYAGKVLPEAVAFADQAVLAENSQLFSRGVFPAKEILANTTEAPVTSDEFHVHFEFCLVRFARPWWDGVFLARSDWTLPGYDPGQISSGSASRPTGAVTLMTVGMLVVRNLSIKANWSDRDKRAMSGSVSLGPFCIAGDDYDSASGSLRHEGMQAIAWLLQVPPKLPPGKPVIAGVSDLPSQ